MKKPILAVLAAVVLMTGCKNDKTPVPSAVSGQDINAPYEKVLKDARAYLPHYYYPTGDGLPLTGNTGAVSLKDKFYEDEEKFRPLLEEFVKEESFEKRREITEKILEILCETEEIPENNGLFSERKLKILRAFWNQDQEKAAEEVPVPENEFQAQYLERAYTALTERYTLALLCSQMDYNLSYVREYTDNEGNKYPFMEYFNVHLYYGTAHEEMSEREFCDSVTAMAAFGQMRDKSPRMLAEFYAFVEEKGVISYNDSASEKCLSLIEKTARELDEILDGAKNVRVIFGGASDDNLSGWDDTADLIVGGDGNDVIDGLGGDDHLLGGTGDDIYIIRENSGCDVIFDCGGRNLIRFEDASNVYAVGFSEEDLKDDVKLCFDSEFVIIKNFKANKTLFDIEINDKKIPYDSDQNPLSDIHEPGYKPDTAQPRY